MLPPVVAALAEDQRGLVGRHQLRAALGADHLADDLVRGGHLARLERGVYRVPGGATLPEHAAFAAALRARPDATITGPVALHLLGVESFHGADAFEILTRPGRRLRGVDFDHRHDPDPGRAVTNWGAIRVTGPLDALIDSAAFQDDVTDRQLRVACDALRGRGLITTDRLVRRLEALHHRCPGAELLAAVLEVSGGATLESEGERRLGPFVYCFDPAFEPQVWVVPSRRPDFFSHRCRHAAEYVGEVDHAHVAARIEDDRRDGQLRDAGVTVTYATKRDLDEPAAWFASFTTTLTLKAHQLGVEPPRLTSLPPVLRPEAVHPEAVRPRASALAGDLLRPGQNLGQGPGAGTTERPT
jgi:hypothetical protein